MNRRRFLLLTACAALPGMAGAAPAAPSQEWRGRAMGADVTLRLHGAGPAQARGFFAEAARLLAQVENLFSLHRDSDLARLNRDGRLRFPAAGMVELLALSDRLHRATGGAFDPTVQPLWLARAQGGDEAAARALAGWDSVAWSRAEVRLARPGMALTFNGLAQGWAADRLAEAAARHGLTDLLIDAGEMRALGAGGWRVGLADAAGREHRRIRLGDRALATSSPGGTLIGPRGLPHILAPDGGAPPWDTISVSADSAALADGLSTALCLMPPEAACAALARLPGCRIELAIPAPHAEFPGKTSSFCLA
ncbi:FAD:protein FMN transferase [Paracoccus versutus]|uniref:FAD:protein FMN transferase n=1 Tax=Paracoccus versutus TaxID=34007 RepID=UPI000921D43B|nr:FAD:protein FMN transferase [Paracoccus versutus]MCJ1898828.1 FAD:protein FMN transferase [Paracoccus versutus]SFX27258.1 thiamine biosynthesis lipoprotein [Paracoccus pantotrophus]